MSASPATSSSRASRLAQAAIVAALLPGAACRQASPPEPKPGGLVIGQVASAVTLDPHAHDEMSTYPTLAHFYGTLVAFGPEMQLRPSLATAWENPSDTVWRFHLRSGVVFHDGRPLTAEDAAASIRRAQRPASRVRHYLQTVEQMRVTDDATLEIVTRHPTPILLSKLAFIAMVPRDSPETILRPVGTGPYAFVSGAPGQAILGERFSRYWGPAPAFDRVTILALPDSRERAEAVARGRADVVAHFPQEYWDWGRRQGSLRLLSRRGLAVSFLSFAHKPGDRFLDRRVRRAIALAIDREALARQGAGGLAIPLDQIVPPVVFGYADRLGPMIRDPAAARRLLQEAGLAAGLDAPMLLPDSVAGLGAEVARQLGSIGVRLRPTPLAWPDFYARWYRDRIPLALTYPWAAGSGDASDILDDLLHSPKDGYGGSNRLGYRSQALDRLIERAATTLDQPTRRELLAQAMAVVREDLPVIPLLQHLDLYAAREGLEFAPRLDQALRAFDVRPAPGGPRVTPPEPQARRPAE